MVCGNFILPEPASYVFFYAFSNLRNLLYIIFEKAVQEIPADKTVWYELPAQAVEIKTAVVGFCSYSGCFYL